MNYYNEFDPKAAAWLRELIKAGLIAPGDVDERSICDVRATDLVGYRQCHFFAGIGGWSLALRLAGVPNDAEVWTGSCPCQPFSCAGKGEAQADERHLWPDFFRLIRECRPERVFGEQVAAAIGFGWLDGLSTDLETEGYAVGACVLGAHSVGAPHKRQRLYWVADSQSQRRARMVAQYETGQQKRARAGGDSATDAISLADLQCSEWRPELPQHEQHGNDAGRHETPSWTGACGEDSAAALGDGIQPGLEGYAGDGDNRDQPGWDEAREAGPVTETGGVMPVVQSDSAGRYAGQLAAAASGHGQATGPAGGDGPMAVTDGGSNDGCVSRSDERGLSETDGKNYWSDSKIIQTRDGKFRRIPIEPEFFPLAHGIPGHVGLLRGYGNAIVPQVAAEFVKAYYEEIIQNNA